ncbi:CaiB/BaiF CoA transferase family protein [Cytobacillus kochii]|nr:CaiB/BaiF CoA-transferase family protein [Cytobacillus kochii]MCM3322982.1 CoA transferase [Cytobacillus kochii]MCM3345378.1 CoA transferase [Cytobacillus kochii]
MSNKALSGLKVLELGQLIAGPFASKLLAEFGADVIKIEPPTKGDPLRTWRVIEDETSLWWYVQSRNKKSITLDLKKEEGQKVLRALVKEIDILIENFRPGTLEKWGIGYEELKKINPRLVMVRVSGYGQDGPYKDKPGFGSIGEAMGGLRFITGYPDLPPVRVGISIGDSLSALYAVIGALIAVYHRDVNHSEEGQVIDVALYESVFSLMESILPEYGRNGVIRERTGSTLPGITPSNTYLCSDGKYIVIGANGDTIFKRLMKTIGREELSKDSRFENNIGRSKHAKYLDQLIEAWTSQHPLLVVKELLDEAGVPAGSIYSIKDIVNDPHYQNRNMIQEVPIDGIGTLKMPGIVPKLSKTPGEIKWAGPNLGSHTEDVLMSELSLTKEQIAKLREKGII